MDETETRIAALEGIVLEWLALAPPQKVDVLSDLIRAWPDKQLRAQGLAIVQDARERFDEVSPGWRIPPNGSETD